MVPALGAAQGESPVVAQIVRWRRERVKGMEKAGGLISKLYWAAFIKCWGKSPPRLSWLWCSGLISAKVLIKASNCEFINIDTKSWQVTLLCLFIIICWLKLKKNLRTSTTWDFQKIIYTWKSTFLTIFISPLTFYISILQYIIYLIICLPSSPLISFSHSLRNLSSQHTPPTFMSFFFLPAEFN